MPDLSKYRKAITAVLGAAAILVSAFFPEYQPQLASVIAIATALGVYVVSNRTE